MKTHSFFFRNASPFCPKQQTNIHIFFMSKSVRTLGYFSPSCSYSEGLEEILKRPFEMDRSWQSGYWVTPTTTTPSFGLFYNLIKSALCFATFQALISGLGRVKRPRQFEKGSLRHKEAACSQSFSSSTPPRQKGEGGSKRVIHWRVIVRT